MTSLLSVAIERETDIILVRQRTRLIAAEVGFDSQDQTRITTAVSEIVRNVLEYAKSGRIEYGLAGDAVPQTLEIVVRDRGPGIADPANILAGGHRSTTGMGVGILGARRLMDDFALETNGGGTTVRMGKRLPPRARFLKPSDLKELTRALSLQEGPDPVAEVRRQNQEMLAQLDELHKRQQELMQLNQELQDTNRGVVALYAELDDRADHLRRADELKSRFLSNMSHEFRTPLNSILALSRLLLSRSDGDLGSEQEKQVQFIRKAAETLTDLVNDLLDLAKVEAGKIVVTPEEFTVGELFSTLRGMLRPLLAGEAVALVFETADDVPALVGDEGKISQVLRNFISNALKFTERGEVRVWAQHDEATDTITFCVKDTGIGIAETDLDLIWQEFAQVANPLQARVRGTGLGLPLSKKLAELLGGGVAVESAPGQGSVFSLTVPRFFRHPGEPVESPSSWLLEPDRIPVLSVEDNPADAFAFERSLAGSRYQVLPARSLAEARRALEQITPAAVLLDLVLVGEESWRFLIELKQREATQHVPVIVISTMQDEMKARSLGADDYISKPVEPIDLVQALDRLTGAHSVTRVLMIDDDEISRYLVRQLLPRGAYALDEAMTGRHGLERARLGPDVVLLDLDLPDISGFDCLGILAPGDAAASPPVVILTATRPDDLKRERLRKASGILQKSDLTAVLLLEAIGAAIAGHRTGAS